MNGQCGSYAGYQRHKRYGETPCDDCRTANRDYIRAQRRQSGRTRGVLIPLTLLERAAAECTAETAKQLRALTQGEKAASAATAGASS